MTGVPQRPELSYVARNESPEDRLGTATWTFWYWNHGGWLRTNGIVPEITFPLARDINDMIKAAWDGGEALGYAACQQSVLDALKGSAP